MHHEGAEAAVRTGGSVGVEPGQQKLPGPDR